MVSSMSLLLTFLLYLLCASSNASVIMVTTDTELAACFVAANPGDTCFIPADQVITVAPTTALPLYSSLKLSGGGNSEIDLGLQRSFLYVNVSISIEGLRIRNGRSTDATGSVFTVDPAGFLDLQNCEIINATTVGPSSGAITGVSSSGYLKNVLFRNPSTVFAGSAVFFLKDGSWTFEDVTVTGNNAFYIFYLYKDSLATSNLDITFGGQILVQDSVSGGYCLYASLSNSLLNSSVTVIKSLPSNPSRFIFQNTQNTLLRFHTGTSSNGSLEFHTSSINVTSHQNTSSTRTLFQTSGSGPVKLLVEEGGSVSLQGLGFGQFETPTFVNVSDSISISSFANALWPSFYTTSSSSQVHAQKITILDSLPVLLDANSKLSFNVSGPFVILNSSISAIRLYNNTQLNIVASRFIVGRGVPEYTTSDRSEGALASRAQATGKAKLKITATCSSGGCDADGFDYAEYEESSNFPTASIGIRIFSTLCRNLAAGGGVLSGLQPIDAYFEAPNSAIVFEGNSAQDGGAIMLGSSSSISFNTPNLIIANNTAWRNGGALSISSIHTSSFAGSGNVVISGNLAGNASCAIDFWDASCSSIPVGPSLTINNNYFSNMSKVSTSGCSSTDTFCFPTSPSSFDCQGPPPTSTSTCQDGVWVIPSSSIPVGGLGTISTPVVIEGDVSLGKVVIIITANSGRPSISSTDCLQVETIDVDLSEQDISDIEKEESRRVNLLQSGCDTNPQLHIIGYKPSKNCKKLETSEERTSNSLSAVFKVNSSRCNLWWIILVSVLGGVALLMALILLILKLSPSCQTKIQPFHHTN